MLRNLALLLRSKVALAVLGGLVIAAVGATAGLAVTGAMAHQPSASATASPTDQCISNDQGTGHSSTQTDDREDREEVDGQSQNQHNVRGTIASVDTANSRFVLTACDGTTTTVKVSTTTEFGEGAHRLADLKAGLFVDVEGNVQSDGTLDATSVHVERNASGDDESNGSDSDDKGGGTGTPVTRSDD